MYDVKHYPEDKSYGKAFFDMVAFLNRFNEKNEFIHFHWSRWEWMFARDSFNEKDLSKITLFMKNDEIFGALIFEDETDLYFVIYENETHLKETMVDYFVKNYEKEDIIIPEDQEMSKLLASKGYEKTDWIDPVNKFSLENFEIPKTPGYKIVSLEEDYRLDQIHHALHRGFNHGDDVDYSENKLEERKHMTSSPNFKKKYTFVAVYDDKYVSYAGLWYMNNTKSALVEPVATVPEHRGKYLARACIYSSIKAIQKDGARNIFVGSNRDLYRHMGFEDFTKATRFKKKV